MAKGTKRKKPGVGIDFRRVKSKVGKKLPKAQNETDMSFKSKSINLPGQSLTEDKTGLAVSQRNLTTQELLSQVSHYNERVRKDALTGLQQLFQEHPQEIHKQTGTLLGKVAECIGDPDKAVRAALRELLSNAILPQLKGDMLGPFVPLVMAHLFSALTSLSEPVRSGALDFLEVFMTAAPKQIMHSYLDKALQHFVELLSPVRRSSTVSAHSTLSMLKIVKALQSLLNKAAAAATSASPLPGPTTALACPVGSAHHTLFQQRSQWPPIAPADDLADLMGFGAGLLSAPPPSGHRLTPGATVHRQQQQQQQSVSADRATQAAQRGVGDVLLDELMSCWTECAPGHLAAGPELTAVQCMEATLQCVDLLLHHLPSLFPKGHDSSSVDTILRKVTPHVPVRAPAVKPSQQMHQALVNLNLAAAKLLSRFLPMQAAAAGEEEEGWRARLLDYYTGIMDAGLLLPSRQAVSAEAAQANVPADVCRATLQGVQAGLVHVSTTRQAALLAAVSKLSSRAAARSAVKAACLEFQLGLLAKGGGVLHPDPGTGVALLPEAVLIEWLRAIPKLLWDLGSAKPATTQTALALLHTALRFAPVGSALSSALDSLQPQLCPFYCSLLAPKGKGASQTVRTGPKAAKVVVLGPLAQLPAASQNLAVDMLYYFPTIHETTARTCAVVCLASAYPAPLALRLMDALCSRQPCPQDVPLLISFLVTVLLGQVTDAQMAVSRYRHEPLVQAAARALPRVADPGTVFQAMQPVLLYHSSATAGVLAWRGIIAAATVFAETDARATCSSLGNPASHTAGKGSAKGPSEPLPQGPSPAPDSLTTMTPSFLTALPSVMACYSCHAEPASQPPPPGTTEQGPGMAHGLQQQLKPVFRLLKADPCLMRPYIAALVNQGQYSVGQLPPASPAQPISPCLAQPCDGADKGGVSGPLEHARQADGGDDPLGAWGGAGGRGEAVVAAVQALLALCEEQALLAQVLRLLQPLLETCSTLRAMAMTVGQASQAGAAVLRKCDSLETVLQGLLGSATGL